MTVEVRIPWNKRVLNEELLKTLYVDDELSGVEIAKCMGTSSSVIYNRLREQGISRRATKEVFVGKRLEIDKEEAKRLYVEKGLSIQETAKVIRSSYGTVRRNLLELNVTLRAPTRYASWDIQEASRLYYTVKLSCRDIGEVLGLRTATVKKALSRLDKNIYTEEAKRYKRSSRLDIDEEELLHLYNDEQKSVYWIAKHLSVSETVVINRLRKWSKLRNVGKDYKIRYNGVHGKVTNALRRGELTRPTRCEECSKIRAKLQGHHDDYNHPLKVRWLCASCHRKWHTHHSPILPNPEEESPQS